MTDKSTCKLSLPWIFGLFCLAWWTALAIYWAIIRGEVDHLLWLCDLTLLLTGIGLITKNNLLLSSQFVGMFPVQVGWNLDFWPQLIANIKPYGAASYMFVPEHPTALKILSTFHIFLPLMLIYGILKFGYNKKGWIFQTFLTIPTLILSYITTNKTQDTNWVLGPFWKTQQVMPPLVYLLCWSLTLIIMYWIMHLLFSLLFKWHMKE